MKLFHLSEGLLRSFKRSSTEESQLWVVIGGSEKTGCDVWQLECQASSVTASVQSDHLLHSYKFLVFSDSDQSHSSPRCAEIQPIPQEAAAASLQTCPYQYTRSS